MSAPAAPDGVLVQSIAVDEEGESAGYRVFRDGRYQTLARGGAWLDGERLDGARVEAVERAIADADVERLAERYEGAIGPGQPEVLWVQVAHGGAVRTVSVVGQRRVPQLERLTALLTDAFRD